MKRLWLFNIIAEVRGCALGCQLYQTAKALRSSIEGAGLFWWMFGLLVVNFAFVVP